MARRGVKASFMAMVLMTGVGSSAFGQAMEWVSQLGGEETDVVRDMARDADGNLLTVGDFEALGDYDPGEGVFNLETAGQEDVFISKLDANGNFVWAKRIGNNQEDWGYGIATDAMGNVMVTGSFVLTVDFDPGDGIFEMTATPQGRDAFILKLDPNGDFLWAKQFTGISDEIGYDLATDADDNIYITGIFRNTTDFDPGPGVFELEMVDSGRDAFIAKLDADGNFVWAKRFGSEDHEDPRGIAVDDEGNAMIVGYYDETIAFEQGTDTLEFSSNGDYDIFLAKFDADGEFLWAGSIGGIADDRGLAVDMDLDGNALVTGFFERDPDFDVPVDFDPGPEEFILVSGGDSDAFVLKLDPEGEFLWAKHLDGVTSSEGRSIATDEMGGVYLTGYHVGGTDFDPGEGSFELDWAGGEDVYVLKLDAEGNFNWAAPLAGDFIEKGNAIAVDPSGEGIYTAGEFSGTTDFEPGDGVFNLTSFGSTGAFNIYVHKMVPTLSSSSSVPEDQVMVYPNPSEGVFTIEGIDNIDAVRVISLEGKKVEVEFSQDELKRGQIDLSSLPNGVYVLIVESGGNTLERRVAVVR
jgi:hypothetical protein